MSARGHRAEKMKCPTCLKLVAYSDDAVNERWMRRHGPKGSRCKARAVGNVSLYYDFWIKKGLIPKPAPRQPD